MAPLSTRSESIEHKVREDTAATIANVAASADLDPECADDEFLCFARDKSDLVRPGERCVCRGVLVQTTSTLRLSCKSTFLKILTSTPLLRVRRQDLHDHRHSLALITRTGVPQAHMRLRNAQSNLARRQDLGKRALNA